MAAKPPKPPLKPPIKNLGNNNNTKESGGSNIIIGEKIASNNIELESTTDKCLVKQQSGDCPCTNISIMQLFHEMKQKFPTVPDYIVNQCVIDNCHDREKCIKDLLNELTLHPNVAQAYPSQVFRNNQNLSSPINSTQLIKPLRPVPPTNMSNDKLINNNNNNINNCDRDLNLIKTTHKYDDENFCNNIMVNHKKITSGKICSDMQTQKSDNKNTNIETQQKQFQLPPQLPLQSSALPAPPAPLAPLAPPAPPSASPVTPQRPTTLDFKTKRNLIKQSFNDVITPNQSPIRPVRRAPVPPILSPKTHSNTPSTSTSSPSSLSSNPPSFETNFKSTTSVQSPSGFTDSGESEISVNISLSPKVNLNKNCPPQRHRSTIVLQPDPPFINNCPPPINQKSYTSLNLRLREPGAQSPIEITAGPGLTYTSSSYDAKLGCQKNFQITVNDQGSMISSSRFRSSPNGNSSPHQPPMEEFNNAERNLSPPMELNSINQNIHIPQQDVTMQVLHRQRNKKEQLMKVVEKNKNKLSQVIDEIEILTSPLIPGAIQRLDDEINSLLCDCQDMVNQIENAKSHGINVDNIDDPNSINNRQNPPFPRQKPPRPPPPKKPLHLINNNNINNNSNNNSNHNNNNSSPNTALSNYQQNSTPTIQHQLSISTTSSMDNNASDANNCDGCGPMWTCSMCTFQNHPLLNKCEFCENIRIIPGTIRIVSSNNNCGINSNSTQFNPASPSYLLSHFSNNLNTNSTALSSNSNCVENDSNLTVFALPT